jgi:hypothetical protein
MDRYGLAWTHFESHDWPAKRTPRYLTRTRPDPPGVPDDRQCLTTAKQAFGENPSRGSRSSSPLATSPPHSAYPTIAMVKWVPVPQVDTMRLGWTPRRRAAGGQETAPDLPGCQIRLMSRRRVGRIRTGDPLTPRTMR